jgi:hypothetical protein
MQASTKACRGPATDGTTRFVYGPVHHFIFTAIHLTAPPNLAMQEGAKP